MNRQIFPVAVIVIIGAANPVPAPATDTGSSHNLFILDRLDDRFFFVGRANLATRDGFSDLFFGYADANLRYKLDDHWAVEAGYRHAFLELGSEWRQEYRPMFSLYWLNKWDEWKFSNRNRIELRYFEGSARDRVRYRNESILTSLNTVTKYEFTPYAEEEFFYDITGEVLNMNWLTFGISKTWIPGVKWKLGYRLQSHKFNGEWENRHVLVTGISFLNFD